MNRAARSRLAGAKAAKILMPDASRATCATPMTTSARSMRDLGFRPTFNENRRGVPRFVMVQEYHG
jgi:hypothetical protein